MTVGRTITNTLIFVVCLALTANAMSIPGTQQSKPAGRPSRHISNQYGAADIENHSRSFGDAVGQAMMGVSRQVEIVGGERVVISPSSKTVNDNRRRETKRSTMKHVSHESKPLTAQMLEVKNRFEMRLGDHFSEQAHSDFI